MKLHFENFIDDLEGLIEFLTSETWSFHGTPNLKAEKIRHGFYNHAYTGDNCKSFWIVLDQNIRVGFIRIFDLQDGDPLFDLRIKSQYRGLGIGIQAVTWLKDYIFNNYPDKNRIEANTRQDNYAMRCVLSKCGFLKEAHHRKAWPSQNQMVYDAIGYGITKEDWINGQITPLKWLDFKC